MAFYRRLKGRMAENEIDQKYLSKLIGKSQTYITSRMTGRQPWNMDEVYEMCDKMSIPYEQIPSFFPKGGVAQIK